MSQHELAPLLEFLHAHQGLYRGRGRTTDGFDFEGEFEVSSRVRENLIEIRFRAADRDSAFHDELTWIASDLMTNAPALWTVSTNTPGVLRHELVTDTSENGARRLVFRLGQGDDKRGFRQEIALEIDSKGEIVYDYSWGVPHEDMKPRVRANLALVQSELRA